MDPHERVALAVRSLEATRDALLAQLRAVEAALALLSGEAGEAAPAVPGDAAVTRPRPLKALVYDVIKGSAGPWRADDVVRELERRGERVAAANPRNAVRTALVVLVQSGAAERVAHGAYQATQYVREGDAGAPVC